MVIFFGKQHRRRVVIYCCH